jgi:ribokinase
MMGQPPRQGAVLVAGSINMDIVATATTIPVPGETVAGHELNYYPGGKGANQAIAACRAGAPTRMIGKVGSDFFGPVLRDFLSAEGIATESVGTTDSASGTALIVVADSGENSIVVVPGANGRVDQTSLLDTDFTDVAVGISQFEIPVATIEAFFEACRRRGITTVLNTAPAVENVGRTFELADVLILNETELSRYAKCVLNERTDPKMVLAEASKLRTFPEQLIVVTLGSRGSVALHGDNEFLAAAPRVTAMDTTGAGDCFAGYLAAALARGERLAEGLGLASRAASVCVQRPGAAPSIPRAAELNSAL